MRIRVRPARARAPLAEVLSGRERTGAEQDRAKRVPRTAGTAERLHRAGAFGAGCTPPPSCVTCRSPAAPVPGRRRAQGCLRPAAEAKPSQV
ncbi:hypothetical protein GCM10010398_67370 [Streptomyces fimbriatus]